MKETTTANRLKEIMNEQNLKQVDILKKVKPYCEKYGVRLEKNDLSQYISGKVEPKQDKLSVLGEALKVNEAWLMGYDVPKYNNINFDNATYMKPVIDDDNMVQIPVLGVIKAGIPIEAQEDIIEYIEIPKRWARGGKQFYGLKISGDSMYPKYQQDDIVVFEDSKNYNMESGNNKDCAVMVNGYDATFKKVLISNEGITLIPYNTGAYDIQMYTNKDIEEKPIRIIGIAREKRTRL